MTAESGYTVTVPVRYGDADASGTVNAAQYLRYCEENRVRFLKDLHAEAGGDPVRRPFIVAETTSTFLKRISPDAGQVDVSCTVRAIGRTSLRLLYKLRVSDQIAAEIDTVLVATDEFGRPRVISDSERQFLRLHASSD